MEVKYCFYLNSACYPSCYQERNKLFLNFIEAKYVVRDMQVKLQGYYENIVYKVISLEKADGENLAKLRRGFSFSILMNCVLNC